MLLAYKILIALRYMIFTLHLAHLCSKLSQIWLLWIFYFVHGEIIALNNISRTKFVVTSIYLKIGELIYFDVKKQIAIPLVNFTFLCKIQSMR